MDFNTHRERVYRWLRRCLLGPETDADAGDLYGVKPLDRYQTGILFPIVKGEDGLDPASDVDDDAADGDLDGAGPAPTSVSQPRRRYVPPSSVGMSFYIQGDRVRLQLIPGAVHYAREGERDENGRFVERVWRRGVLGGDDVDAWNLSAPRGHGTESLRQPVFGDRGELFVLWRPLADGWLVTASLSNTQVLNQRPDAPEAAAERSAMALFEAKLSCVIDSGEVGPYPGVLYSLLSDEEQELELQYRHHRVYAIGHGAAVDWDLKDGRVAAIRTEFLPKVEVPQVSSDVGGANLDVLDIGWISRFDEDPAGRCDALDRFIDGFEDWVRDRGVEAGSLVGDETAPAGRILKRMRTAIGRMRAGVAMLRSEPLVARAFGLANLAMQHQMAQADKVAGRTPRGHRWRPFQLAFLLLALESSVDEDSEFRDTLDLIWFPTGGGKTEAYLGLMALVICWRRLKYPTSGGGTAILMRYTLRLLTKDQFRRGARLICALELIRRDTPDLGGEHISLGLWVGGASSPNNFQDAKTAVDQAIEEGIRSPSLLVLESCPWCGDPFDATHSHDAGPQHFRFRCTNAACDFGPGGALPCNVIDTALYETPPTLLLATIDKFARLAWDERSTAFFGQEGKRPPELIVQDELHLIAGALGSVAGLYEAGLETVLALRGVHPKYIASTATIRMAREQVERLYGREAAIFPPPGLDCDDSYFARTLPLTEKPGRLYVGYLAPARDRQHCLAPVAAALLAAPEVLYGDAGADGDDLLDAWWTLLVYHGSLKGVGISRNALQDIESFIARYQREEVARRKQENPDDASQSAATGENWQRRHRLAERLAQLTSHMSADENARTFDRLRLPREEPEALDLVLATNMVSVGLDVSRLAAMIVNGQPLTTAEYIQASSRVGRADVPGIVVANYYRDQARSLSHYEGFRAYHESFYRYVEPTSVTPFTYQARLRALHAALVIAVRHADSRLTANERAGDFNPTDPATGKLIEELKIRCRRADPGRGDDTAAHIDNLAAQWADAAERCRDQRERLVYQGPDSDRRDQRLLYSHEARVKGLWATLHNMRNVENTALVKIL